MTTRGGSSWISCDSAALLEVALERESVDAIGSAGLGSLHPGARVER
jgi:hypothetical protein